MEVIPRPLVPQRSKAEHTEIRVNQDITKPRASSGLQIKGVYVAIGLRLVQRFGVNGEPHLAIIRRMARQVCHEQFVVDNAPHSDTHAEEQMEIPVLQIRLLRLDGTGIGTQKDEALKRSKTEEYDNGPEPNAPLPVLSRPANKIRVPPRHVPRQK